MSPVEKKRRGGESSKIDEVPMKAEIYETNAGGEMAKEKADDVEAPVVIGGEEMVMKMEKESVPMKEESMPMKVEVAGGKLRKSKKSGAGVIQKVTVPAILLAASLLTQGTPTLTGGVKKSKTLKGGKRKSEKSNKNKSRKTQRKRR